MKTILLTLLSILLITTVSANSNDQLIPTDTSVTIGKLSNGITYYIKKNKKPENRVEMRIAMKVGSVVEDDDQQGLAHFTEHMAFNGSTHFRKNELVNYLQSVGVKFGAHLNAYTGFDETVYMLHLPTDADSIVEKGFLVLEDWAHGLSFDSAEIEKERGIIVEEWRLGQGAEQRMLDKYLPVIFQHSKYAERLPIGKKEILETFPHSAIKRYYNEWYRPDLMAVIVVGDIDVKEYEKKIKKYFEKIQSPISPRKRESFPVPGHAETLVSICSDKEAVESECVVIYKTDSKDESRIEDYRFFIMKQLYSYMINMRFNELTRSENPPFIRAFANYGNIGAQTEDAYMTGATVADTGLIFGLKTIVAENEKIKRFGFTSAELKRAKKSVLSNYEKAYNERDKSESANYASELTSAFTDNEPIPGILWEYNFATTNLPSISLDEINKLATAWITDSNRVVVITSPEKEGVVLPSKEQVLSIFEEINKTNLKSYTESLIDSSLVNEIPQKGKIVKEKNEKNTQTTIWTLSNGATIYLKPTKFKDDEILMSCFSYGGQNLYDMKDFYSTVFTNNIVRESGVGNFSKTDLQKTLSGKTVSLASYISGISEGMNGRTTPKDLETFFQLLYLYFTAPRYDSLAFNSYKTRSKAMVANLKVDPNYFYQDQLAKVLTQNHPRAYTIPEESDFDKIDLQRVHQIYKDRFSNAADFTFVFAGNFELETIKPFVEQWIGSLPSNKNFEKPKDIGMRPPKGSVKKDFYKGSDPKSKVNLVFTSETKYSPKEDYYLLSLSDLLDIKLIESLREEKSGVYTLGVQSSMSKYPFENYKFTIVYPCAPDNVDSLEKAALKEIEKIKTNGVEPKDLIKIKETQKRELETSLKTNGYWIAAIQNAVNYDRKLENILKQFDDIEKLSSKNIQDVAHKYCGKDYIKVVLYPESMKQ